MPIRTDIRETLTPRERQELDWEKQSAQMQVDYARETQEAQIKHEQTLKQIEADYGVKLQELQLEYAKLEVRWKSLFRIPSEIVLLPVKLILALAIPISVITKHELPSPYWELMK